MTVRLKSDRQLLDWRAPALALEAAINTVMVGQDEAVRLLCVATFTRGHVILEGNIGVGKTTLLRAVARTLGGGYERIEGTVDLMPSDLIYYTYVVRYGLDSCDTRVCLSDLLFRCCTEALWPCIGKQTFIAISMTVPSRF